jgi:hypothetical protein
MGPVTTGKTPRRNSRTRSRSDPIDPAVGDTPWTAWLLLLPIVTILPWLLVKLHYHLPESLPPT